MFYIPTYISSLTPLEEEIESFILLDFSFKIVALVQVCELKIGMVILDKNNDTTKRERERRRERESRIFLGTFHGFV